LECPECSSRKAAIITGGKKAKCADCQHVYKIEPIPDPEEPMPKARKKRTAAPGVRHRRDNGPKELDVKPVPPPPPDQLGTLHLHTESIIEAGPKALLHAHHRASKLSAQFGEKFKDEWRLKTKWLSDLEASREDISADPKYGMTARNRARAQYAMRWRPTFLAVVALSHSTELGACAAKVSKNTVVAQRREDPEFDSQVIAAQDHCIELLHAVTMRSALEGEIEPVYWQGIQVGHIKKFDNRLRIEMLRAHMPKTFKTPGSKVAIATGEGSNNMFICGPEEREELIKLRREALERIAAKRADVTALPAQTEGQLQQVAPQTVS
jgi:hypothetical protein